MPLSSLISSHRLITALLTGLFCFSVDAVGQTDDASFRQIQPVLQAYCAECHSGDVTEADVDFDEFHSVQDLKKNVAVWIKVRSMLNTGQMPPKDSEQPTDAEKKSLQTWVQQFLAEEARRHAGDPGPVVLRRLSNTEYAYTIQDLTGLPDLNPVREFPIDGAAGEGFTNTGSGLVMSPSLVQKYLDAAKQVAQHATFFPDGLRFQLHCRRYRWFTCQSDSCRRRARD